MRTNSQIKFHDKITSEPVSNGVEHKRLDQLCIYMERSDLFLWTIWKCFHKKIAYMPVDQNIPLERLTYMLNETGIKTCITCSENVNKLPGIEEYIVIDSYDDLYKLSEFYGDSSIAYIVFTSGTTGKPKGVQIKRESALSFIENFSDMLEFHSKDKILCSTSPNFDIFFVETILALYKGMDIVVVDESEKISPRKLCSIIETEGIDVLQITPSRMQGLVAYDQELKALHKVKKIMLGGEALPINLLYRLQDTTNARVFNLYGPAETTVWATVAELTDSKEVNIGKPIPSYRVYILDENRNIVMNGAEGQIAIGLDSLPEGYINRPELSKEKFVSIPTNEEQVYLTGDLGQKKEDGSFNYLGRMDRQVKIRGNRIELEEVESTLRSIEGVNQVYVFKEDDEFGGKLIAFCSSQNIVTKELLEIELKKKLPDYMIPQEYMFVDSFPTTINGKVAGEELVEQYHKLQSERIQEIMLEYSSEVEKEIMEIIKSAVEPVAISIISPDTKLEDIGIHSLHYIQLVVVIEEKYEINFEDQYLIVGKFEKIKELAGYVEKRIREKSNLV